VLSVVHLASVTLNLNLNLNLTNVVATAVAIANGIGNYAVNGLLVLTGH